MSEVLLTNTAAGGTVGAAVTKSTQPAAAGAPFDVVHVDPASSLTYTDDAPPGHTRAYRLVRGGGAVTLQWNAALAAFGPSVEFVAELWVKVPAARPPELGATVLARGYANTVADFAARAWELVYDYRGRLSLRDPGGREALCRTPIRLGQWYRVLVRIVAGESATIRLCEGASLVTHSRGTALAWDGGATVAFEYRASSSQMLGEVLHGPVRVGRGDEMLTATTVGHEGPLASAGLPLLAVEPGSSAPLVGTAEALDAPIDVYSWRRVSGRGGQLRGDGARRVYRPAASLTGYVETFAFKVTDTAGYDSDEVTVTHQVLPTSDRTGGGTGGGDVAVLPTVEPPTGYVPPPDPTPDPEPEPEPENVPPVAALTVDAPDLTAAFDGSGSSDVDGVVTSWRWEFGDGATATGATASHTYAAAGTYTVRLTVTDDDGAQTTVSRSLTVAQPVVPPSATFTESVSAQTVSVDGSSSSDPAGGVIVSYAWDFGDGTEPVVGPSPTASHTYAVGNATYNVMLTVTDDEGATDSATVQVTVGIVDKERPSAVSDLRQTATPVRGAVVEWGAATDNVAIRYYRLRLSTNGGSDVYLDQTKLLTYTLENLDPANSYVFSVEAYDTASPSNVGPRTRLPLTVLAEEPPTPFDQIEPPLGVLWAPANATTAPDTLDPTLTRVQSVSTEPGTFATSISHGTEASQPLLVTTEDGVTAFRFDGVNDRLLRTSTSILRNLPGFAIGVRFRAAVGFDGLRSLVVHSAERAYLALIDGKLRVGGTRVTPTGVQTAYFFGDVDLRGEWHDIVAKYDLPSDRFKLWLDGVLTFDVPYLVEAAGANSSDSTGTINLGSWNGTGNDPFAGEIEHAVIYRHLISDEAALEVGRTLRGGASPVVDPDPDPDPEPEPEPEQPLEPVPGDLALEFAAAGLQVGPVASWPSTVGGMTVAQATLAGQPTREVIDGRAAVTFNAGQWLSAGTNAIGRAWPGASVYALLWLPNGHHWHQHVAAWNDSKGQRFGARLVSGRAAVSARRSTSGDSHRTTVGVADLGGAWHFVGWHYDTASGTARTTIDGKLDHETGLPWNLGAATSDVASTMFALGSSKTSAASEPLIGSLNRLRVYKGAHTPAQARAVMNDIGFVPPTPAAAPWTATMSTDPRDVYRARLTVSEAGTYQLRHSRLGGRQVQQFTGTSLFVPFLDPGVHNFAVRKQQSDGSWSVWKALPTWKARDWPAIVPGKMRWSMPAAWGVTYPITTIRLRSGQSSLTISRDGHYRILPPLESVDAEGNVLPAGLMETNRFDLNIGNSTTPLTEVLIHVEGGEFHSSPTARINLKSRATTSTAWLYMQIDGVDFTGGNAGDTIQLSWNEVTDGTFVVQNSHGEQITWGGVEHSDTQQLYAGPNTWKCDGWDAASDYQGFILYPAQFGRFVDHNPGYVTSWPMSRIRIHQATRTTKTEGVTTAGTPFYSFHHPLTGAPWPSYDKTPGGPNGLYVTRGEKNPNGNISWQYVNPDTWELSTQNNTPGHWDGVQQLPQGATPPQMNLTGSAKPGRNFVNPGYSPTPPPPA